MVSDLEIRPARKSDATAILGFIRELAEFEKLLHEVTATETDLRRALFGPAKVAEAIMGVYQGQSVAYALFHHNFSTFLGKPGIWVEDLYVRPAFRRRGIGMAMLRHVGQIAVKRGCGRVEWSALDWNARAISLYKRLGAVPMDEWTIFRLAGERLHRFAHEV